MEATTALNPGTGEERPDVKGHCSWDCWERVRYSLPYCWRGVPVRQAPRPSQQPFPLPPPQQGPEPRR